VLKITTAQTLAIDSLERKIMNLSKRNPAASNELAIQKQFSKIKAVNSDGTESQEVQAKDASAAGSEARSAGESQANKEENLQVGEARFQDIFPDIQEDEFESSDDEFERKKNEKLERLGKLAAPHQVKVNGEEGADNRAGQIIDKRNNQDDDDQRSDKDAARPTDDGANTDRNQQNRILVVEEGDILARYRIPIQNNKVDYDLQLPDDSDSSNFSSDQEKETGVMNIASGDQGNSPAGKDGGGAGASPDGDGDAQQADNQDDAQNQ